MVTNSKVVKTYIEEMIVFIIWFSCTTIMTTVDKVKYNFSLFFVFLSV